MKRFCFLTFFCFQTVIAQKEIKHIVYFETDKYSIPETEMHRLLLFLDDIESIDIQKISIYGFCDDRGSHSYNMSLSQNRANTIKQVFTNKEFDNSLISNTDGKGELLLKIIKDNHVDKIRGLNRKVEIIVFPVFPARENNFNSQRLEDILNGDLIVGEKILLENLLFERGYSYLIPESRVLLSTIAKILKKRKDIHFTIQGHVCCTNGERDAIDGRTKKRNLSQARAKYIYEYLLRKGVSSRRMKYIGMKRKFPLGGPQRLDRRVELLVTKVGS
ncbi:OmpA family protein [uncultured Winogradskyella sp.]|jgi:outer membrane protein OmpA-like peptidoglycan-associated protein|uniref:OmpA family protein n=1 Tax=uncultured Winogradskyella sp. TaxID=395353 RepID=UPI0025D5AC9E|nr:OmpA family protein [uncultured Winogradskyella sp.]